MPDEDTTSAPEEPPNPEPEKLQRRGERWARSESDDESNLEFLALKRRRMAELTEEPGEERSLVYPRHLPKGRWPDKGPSAHWEEV